MKIGEIQRVYRDQIQYLREKEQSLVQRREDLQKQQHLAASDEERSRFSEEAATLELSIKEIGAQYDENMEFMGRVLETKTAYFNAEVSKQQSEALAKAAKDMAKIMEVARRIAKGGLVPYSDEKKLMDYSMELYMSSKNMALLNEQKEKEEYASLWEDEEELPEHDPQGVSENASFSGELPDLITDF